MSMKVGSRQVDGVTIVDCSGRITLGEGSVILRDTVRDLLAKGNKKIVLNLAGRQLHRQLGHWRTGQRLHHHQESGRRTQTAQPDQEGQRPAPDHQALYRLRRERRRSRRRKVVQVVAFPLCMVWVTHFSPLLREVGTSASVPFRDDFREYFPSRHRLKRVHPPRIGECSNRVRHLNCQCGDSRIRPSSRAKPGSAPQVPNPGSRSRRAPRSLPHLSRRPVAPRVRLPPHPAMPATTSAKTNA